MTEPAAGEPIMPESYGVRRTPRQDASAWQAVTAKLSTARNYWVATTRPDGRPHTVPVWGIWLEDTFWFATDRASRKGRNLAANPLIAVHLESGDDVVIIEGIVEEVDDPSLLSEFADTYEAKYKFRPDPANPAQVTYRLRLRLAHSWDERDFPETATRWEFDRE